RLLGDAGGDAGGDPQRAALADGPARAAVAALELSAVDPALSGALRALGDAREGACSGPGPASADRADRAAGTRAGAGRRRRGSGASARSSLRLPLGRGAGEGRI